MSDSSSENFLQTNSLFTFASINEADEATTNATNQISFCFGKWRKTIMGAPVQS